jgi:hypothetical protein
MHKRTPIRAFLRCETGVSLTELLVSASVALVLGMLIYTFIMFSSKSLRKVLAMQMLQQEGTTIAEIFRSKVRNASYVTVGYDDPPEPPTKDTSFVYSIRLFDVNGTIIGNFDISDEVLYMDYYLFDQDKDKVLTKNLWVGGDPPTYFKVFKHGNHVEFHLNLYKSLGDDMLFLAEIVGDVRCKNWVNY